MQRYLWLVALLVIPVVSFGQDDLPTLTVGEPASGTLTDRNFEVNYTFTGEAGEVIVFQAVATEEDTLLDEPELIIFDNEDSILVDSGGFFSYQEVILALRLPYSGRYTVMVTRDDGRTGDSTGDYALILTRVQRLFDGETVVATALNASPPNYYSVEPDGQPFSVYYEFSNGEMDPEIEAYRIEGGELVRAATLRGNELRSGTIGLVPGDSALFIFTVGDSPFASYYDDRVERADYRLRLIISE